MKRIVFASLVATSFVVPSAHAQSSVQIYGLMDAGITMLSNVGGSRAWLFDSGIQQNNRIGFRGTEDLGGGNKAIFTLENGFSLNNGALGQGGLLFGRQAYVGLSNQYGTLTFGRQYDFMGEYLPMDATAAYIGGLYAWHLGNSDRVAGAWLNNAVKFESGNFHGLTFGAMYSFGGVAGDFNEGSGVSAGATYVNGPLNVGVAYTKAENTSLPAYSYLGLSEFDNQPTPPGKTVTLNKTTNFGAGASYTIGQVTLHALYTWTQFSAPGGSSTLKIYEAGANYQITPALAAGAGYAYSSMSPNHWGEISAGLDYFLSKRTDVYTTVSSIHASGPDVVAVLPVQMPSGNKDQTAVRIGMRTKF